MEPYGGLGNVHRLAMFVWRCKCRWDKSPAFGGVGLIPLRDARAYWNARLEVRRY